MKDRRKLRKSKRQPRGSWRAEPRPQVKEPDDSDFDTIIRTALTKHPLHLLNLAGFGIRRVTATAAGLDNFITNLSMRPCRETTALLAVVGEMLVNDEAVRSRCRQEVASRSDRLPKWIVGLGDAHVYKAVRRTNVFGDNDEVVIGARFADGSECIFGVFVDHLLLSGITDVVLRPGPIDAFLSAATRRSDDDSHFVEMDLADARVWIDQGAARAVRLWREEWWLDIRPVVSWLTSLMPAGGSGHQQSDQDFAEVNQLLDTFFTSPPAAPFNGADYRHLLEALMDSGAGDPLRWSPARVKAILGDSLCDDTYIPLEIALDAPALLRAYVPFAHARSGISDRHTDDVLAMIDRLARSFKRLMISNAVEEGELVDESEAKWFGERPGRAS